MRASKVSRWRAAALIGVHVLVALHVAHWMRTGTTLSPLEPSEAMEFVKHDLVNAGLVFFGLTILSTLVLGRWFCGWACHVVALQDLCLAMLKRVGIRPRPLRSRLLGFVPGLAALYMFAWPLVYRLWVQGGLGTPRLALTRGEFWATFPPWPVALVTFAVCGFVVVYFLGAKGFCTYGCPYGAIFSLADRVAVGRIRVTDACEGCGHCTATCTSNVLVHLEVARHGMVVDPGCMKCLDCVSVCPKEALYFGFGKPALGSGARAAHRAKPARSFGAELGLAGAFLASFLVFRGLYGVVPFLLALGLAGILAVGFTELAQLLRRRERSFLGRTLRRDGRFTRAGLLFLLVMGLMAALTVHSALIQLETRRATGAFELLRDRREAFLVDPSRRLSDDELARTLEALESLGFVERYGLLPVRDAEVQRAWLLLFSGSDAGFEQAFRALAADSSEAASLHYDLGRFHAARGDLASAAEDFEASLAARPSASVFDQLARLLFEAGRTDEALAVFRRSRQAFPTQADLAFNQGVVQAMLGRSEEAIATFREVLELAPGRRDALENLVDLLRATGREAEARALLERRVGSTPPLEAGG